MGDILATIAKYGYGSLFAAMLMEAIGLPIPGALALVAAGAASAAGAMHPVEAFGVAITATLIGDSALYVTGRLSGWQLLGFLCGLSLSPGVCILRSAAMLPANNGPALPFAVRSSSS